MTYTLSTTKGFIKSNEIVAMLDSAVPLQLAHINAIKDIEAKGCRYSNQDFDVLSAARSAIGKSEVPSYAAKWVEAMTGARG